jgi:hypothetical protein
MHHHNKFDPPTYYKKHVKNEYTLNVIMSVCHYPINDPIKDSITLCDKKSPDYSGLCVDHSNGKCFISLDNMKSYCCIIVQEYLNTIANTIGINNKLKAVNDLFTFILMHPYIMLSNPRFKKTIKDKLDEFSRHDTFEPNLDLFNPENFTSWMFTNDEKLDYSKPKYSDDIKDNKNNTEINYCSERTNVLSEAFISNGNEIHIDHIEDDDYILEL